MNYINIQIKLHLVLKLFGMLEVDPEVVKTRQEFIKKINKIET